MIMLFGDNSCDAVLGHCSRTDVSGRQKKHHTCCGLETNTKTCKSSPRDSVKPSQSRQIQYDMTAQDYT